MQAPPGARRATARRARRLPTTRREGERSVRGAGALERRASGPVAIASFVSAAASCSRTAAPPWRDPRAPFGEPAEPGRWQIKTAEPNQNPPSRNLQPLMGNHGNVHF